MTYKYFGETNIIFNTPRSQKLRVGSFARGRGGRGLGLGRGGGCRALPTRVNLL